MGSFLFDSSGFTLEVSDRKFFCLSRYSQLFYLERFVKNDFLKKVMHRERQENKKTSRHKKK
ncbi:hypothetical protein COU01_04320 [Candidatus Falkowbacteria bacterium CG10_big_fil_rev_8_21_14_0_10_44_15]|uniref:Uncharacterized protein n=1 Tax=Candidatus Falkowbacteria bacterium CG10_big_fil_rev_8_21_14_0_10_44_15 TaxID=1974569 RepID=A0A2H0V0I7_9BACT|nr:MAG: hypothetical protein COU01_04320 [Candidatus Falkowbacteria bacterium CG10_big_fil_rev_8_21_14_0_10_44_15]